MLSLNVHGENAYYNSMLAPTSQTTRKNQLSIAIKRKIEQAINLYAQEIQKTLDNYKASKDIDQRSAELFFAYYNLIQSLVSVINVGRSIFVYPISGPDISFQLCADTFLLNKGVLDGSRGRDWFVLPRFSGQFEEM